MLTHLFGELVPEVAVQEQLGEDAYDEQQHRSELHAQYAYLRTDKTTLMERRVIRPLRTVQRYSLVNTHADHFIRGHAKDPAANGELHESRPAEHVFHQFCAPTHRVRFYFSHDILP